MGAWIMRQLFSKVGPVVGGRDGSWRGEPLLYGAWQSEISKQCSGADIRAISSTDARPRFHHSSTTITLWVLRNRAQCRLRIEWTWRLKSRCDQSSSIDAPRFELLDGLRQWVDGAWRRE